MNFGFWESVSTLGAQTFELWLNHIGDQGVEVETF